eukprot:7381675-Prymnesium_polylepis.2
MEPSGEPPLLRGVTNDDLKLAKEAVETFLERHGDNMERCSGRKETLLGLLLAEAAGAELPTLDEAGRRGKRVLAHCASVQGSAAKARKGAADRARAVAKSDLGPDAAADR